MVRFIDVDDVKLNSPLQIIIKIYTSIEYYSTIFNLFFDEVFVNVLMLCVIKLKRIFSNIYGSFVIIAELHLRGR